MSNQIFEELPGKRRTVKELIGWGMALIIVFAVIALFGSYVFTGLGWLTLPTKLYDVEKVQETYTSYVERSNELEGLIAQIDALDSRIEMIREKNANYTGMEQWSVQDRADYDNLGQTRLGLVTAYNRSCAQYNADWQNWFKTSSVALTDLQLTIPTGCKLRGN